MFRSAKPVETNSKSERSFLIRFVLGLQSIISKGLKDKKEILHFYRIFFKHGDIIFSNMTVDITSPLGATTPTGRRKHPTPLFIASLVRIGRLSHAHSATGHCSVLTMWLLPVPRCTNTGFEEKVHRPVLVSRHCLGCVL